MPAPTVASQASSPRAQLPTPAWASRCSTPGGGLPRTPRGRDGEGRGARPPEGRDDRLLGAAVVHRRPLAAPGRAHLARPTHGSRVGRVPRPLLTVAMCLTASFTARCRASTGASASRTGSSSHDPQGPGERAPARLGRGGGRLLGPGRAAARMGRGPTEQTVPVTVGAIRQIVTAGLIAVRSAKVTGRAHAVTLASR